ncbi:MAG: hypothetical protein ACLUJG_11625 [Lawsonibacter sp.]
MGEDQKQHCELTRDVAQRFNNIYGDVFKIPEPYIPKAGARIMGLTNPESKMSKSIPGGLRLPDGEAGGHSAASSSGLSPTATPKTVCAIDPVNKPGVANLMNIYSAVTGKSFQEIEFEFSGCGYGKFKPAVGEAVVETLRPIREEAARILADKAYLESVYKAGAEKASYTAAKTLRKVYKKVGFVAR